MADESEDRRLLALNAVWEIEALADLLLNGLDQSADYFHVRGVMLRTRELSRLIMSSLDDPTCELSELKYLVTGLREQVATAEVTHG